MLWLYFRVFSLTNISQDLLSFLKYEIFLMTCQITKFIQLSWFVLVYEKKNFIIVIGLGDDLFLIGLKKDQILVWSIVFGFFQCEQRLILFHFFIIFINGSFNFKSVIYQSFLLVLWLYKKKKFTCLNGVRRFSWV
jgi:hypothetical protein